MRRQQRWSKMLAVAGVCLFAATAAEGAVKTRKVPATGGKGTISYIVTSGTENGSVPVQIPPPDEGWLNITSAPTAVVLKKGKGTIKVKYQVESQPAASSRTGLLTIKVGEAAPVPIQEIEQAGAPCKIRLSSNATTLKYYGGSATVSYTHPDGCSVAITSDPWITTTSGDRSFDLSVGMLDGDGRTGKVNLIATVEGDPAHVVTDKKVYTVIQKKLQPAGAMKLGRATPVTVDNVREAAASVLYAAKTVTRAADNYGPGDVSSLGPTRSVASSPEMVAKSIARSGGLKAFARNESSSGSCPNGGAYRISETATTYSETYTNCRDGLEERHGTMFGNRSYNAETGLLRGSLRIGTSSAPFTVTLYTDTGIIRTLTKTALSMKIGAYRVDADFPSFTMTASGSVDNHDTDEQDIHTVVEAKNFRMKYDGRADGFSLETDGSIRSTVAVDNALTSSEEVVLDGFTVSITQNRNAEWVTVDGAYALATYPANACTDGTFNVDGTLIYGYDGGAIGGTVSVNNVEVSIAADGTGKAMIGDSLVPVADINTTCSADL